MKKVIKFDRQSQKEITFDEFGIKEVPSSEYKGENFTWAWFDEEIALADIDIKGGLDFFQPRSDSKLDQAYIQKLAMHVENGKYPGPVLINIGKDKDGQVDGNHTISAALLREATHIHGYYKYQHPKPKLVATVLNGNTNGKGTDTKQSIYDCVKFFFEAVEEDGQEPDNEKWAKLFGVTLDQFRKAKRHEELKQELIERGVQKVETLLPAHLDAISKVSNQVSEDTAAEIASLAVEYEVKASTVGEWADHLTDTSVKLEKKAEFVKDKTDELRRTTNNGTIKVSPARGKRGKQARHESSLKEIVSKGRKIRDEGDESKMRKFVHKDGEVLQGVQEIRDYLDKLLIPVAAKSTKAKR